MLNILCHDATTLVSLENGFQCFKYVLQCRVIYLKGTHYTTISSYIWKLKDKKIPHFVNWSIKARGHAFSSGGKACDLCLTEKLTILTADQNTMLNRRDELLETCRHRRKHLLVSLFERKKPPDTTINER